MCYRTIKYSVFSGLYVCTFKPGSITGWGSEGVKRCVEQGKRTDHCLCSCLADNTDAFTNYEEQLSVVEQSFFTAVNDTASLFTVVVGGRVITPDVTKADSGVVIYCPIGSTAVDMVCGECSGWGGGGGGVAFVVIVCACVCVCTYVCVCV